MNFEELISQFGLYLATFIVCLVSGIVPFVNAEAYLILVSALSDKSDALPIILIATSGQMIAKSIMYLAGAGFLKLPTGKYEQKINKVKEKFTKWENKTAALIFVSGSLGFPPFYIVSILCGVLKINFMKFFLFGFLGRLLRFTITVLFPQLIKGFM